MKTPLLILPGLLTASVVAGQNFAITGLLPARNATAPLSADINVTFSQPLSPASTGTLHVFSSQQHGRLPGQTLVMGNVLVFNPLSGFKPGEVVAATVTTAAQSSTGAGLATPQVFQFRAAAVGGTGSFSSGAEVAVGARPSGIAVADVDGDGDLDILTANSSSNTVSVRLNNGRGGFSGSTEVVVGPGPASVATADVDADGDLDLITANYGGMALGFSDFASVRLNDGRGNFSGGSDPEVGASPGNLVLADADGDGDLDLFTTNGGRNTVGLRYNDGQGSFGTGHFVNGIAAFSIAVTDVDGDGDMDLLTPDGTQRLVRVDLNTGNGTFTHGTDIPMGAGPGSVAAGDLDGDGDVDLLVRAADKVWTCLNSGSGVFTPGPAVTISGSPYFITLADVDGDTDLDLLTANSGSNSASIRLNDGRGVFGGGAEVAVDAEPLAVATGDLDGDGDVDLLTGSQVNNTISTRFNNGTGPLLTTARPGRLALLALYPNPAHGAVRLQVPQGTREVALLNALGQRLQVVPVAGRETEILLPLGELSAGIYTVQAGAATGRLVVQ